MKKSKTTILEIADQAGVSPATVSRVLNHRSLVKADTISKVEEAMRTLGYSSGSGNTSGIDNVPVIILNIPDTNTIFYHEIVRGAKQAAKTHDCHIIVNEANLRSDDAEPLCKLAKRIQAFGVVMVNSVSESFLSHLSSVCPVVQCCEHNDNTRFSYVSIDDYSAAKLAADHLISCGCKKIAFLNGPSSYKYSRERYRGFLDSMNAAGLPVVDRWVCPVPDVSYDLALASAQRLLDDQDRPDAFVTVSDILAMAVINAASHYHLTVPDDIMVTGFDNIAISKMMNPTITTVSQPRYQMGYTAIELLCDTVAHPGSNPRCINMNTELIVRASTSKN